MHKKQKQNKKGLGVTETKYQEVKKQGVVLVMLYTMTMVSDSEAATTTVSTGDAAMTIVSAGEAATVGTATTIFFIVLLVRPIHTSYLGLA